MDNTEQANIWRVKKHVKKLLDDKGISYTIADKLGKNITYLQKFIKEKSPRRLDEDFRHRLAVILQVDEQELTDLPIRHHIMPLDNETVIIDIISDTPCCGCGSDAPYADEIIGKWIMPLTDFKELTFAKPENIKQMHITGDSMEPTIKDGDYILADTSFRSFDIDGIYLIRMLNGLAVKRLQAGLNDIKILSDNKKYEPITASVGEVQIIGKVIKIMNIENV